MEKFKRILLVQLRLLGAGVIGSAEAVRQLLKKALEAAQELALLTATRADDAIIGVLAAVVNNDRAWQALYELIFGQPDQPNGPAVVFDAETIPPAILAAAPTADRATILEAIRLLIEVFKLLRG